MSVAQCTCLEVKGEDPKCSLHGVGTDYWADCILESPLERSEVAHKVRLYDELIAALREIVALYLNPTGGTKERARKASTIARAALAKVAAP